MRARTTISIGVGVIAVLLLAVAGVLFVFTNTDWGRERVRRRLVPTIAGSTHGILHVGSLHGNLLRGAMLRDVTLTDGAGAPFFAAKEVRGRCMLSALWHRRLYFDNVVLVRPVIVLNRPPGGTWNFDRIFPRDTLHKGPPGFGSWIRLTHVTMIDGDIVSRSPWAPDQALTRRQQDSVIAYVLGPQERQNIVRVPGGFQRVSAFRRVDGTFPLIQVADPTDVAQTIDVASLRMEAQPLRPPALHVVDATGRFVILHDTLHLRIDRGALTGSRFAGRGWYNLNTNDLRLRIHADSVATNDLLWIDPDIPTNGTGRLDFALDWRGKTSDYVASHASLRVAGATLTGNIGVFTSGRGDTLLFHDTELQVQHLDTRTIAQLFPTLRSPRQGYLTGRVAAAGSVRRMLVDGDIAFDDPRTGRSRVIAWGVLGSTHSAFVASDLHLMLRPFCVPLARVVMPTLPIGGTVTGSAVLNGSTSQWLAVRADVLHTDVTGRSHVVGRVAYASGNPSHDGVPLVNADVHLLPLSLATVGRFVPAAGLRGTATGQVRVTGPLRHLMLDTRLTTPDGGSVTAQGSADLASTEKSYDITTATHLFDASQVTSKAPRTSVTADATLHGVGTDPETLHATLTVNAKASTYDSVAVDSAIVRAAAANGVLHVDTLAVRVPHGGADVRGAVGLTGAHTGELRYSAFIDSLGALSHVLPSDTGVMQPRPGILAERVRWARQDSVRLARATEVQRAISGRPMPRTVVDTPRVVSRTVLLGSARTDGTIRGNPQHFDVRGTLLGTNLVAYGNTANLLSAQYVWQNAFTSQSYVGVGVRAAGVSAAGFALDSVLAQGSYRHPRGTLVLAVQQGTSRKYAVNADYLLDRVRSELRLNDMRLQLDSTLYTSSHTSLIHFGSGGVDVDSLDIQSIGGGSRIFVDGRIPIQGAADARFDITNFEIGHIATLLQSDVPMHGVVSVAGTVTGTATAPTLHGVFGASRVVYGGTKVPELHGTIDYAAQTLHGSAEANLEGGPPFLLATGAVPVNLAFTGVTGSRIPIDRALDVRIDADSLPLDRVSQITDLVDHLEGLAVVHTHVGGTLAHPSATGYLALDRAAGRVIPTGVTYYDVNGRVRLAGDTVAIDSLVAHSGGSIRLNGTLGLATLADPSLALRLVARNARVLDNNHGTLTTDADLTLGGRFKAAQVDGAVRLRRGVIDIPEPNGKQIIGTQDPTLFAVLDTATTTNRDLFPTQSPLFKNLRANVSVTIDRDVFVRSRDANVELYTEEPLRVTVNQRRQSFVVDGTILSDRGEYRFQSRRFTIRRGSALFVNTPKLNPTLQISGEYEVQIPGNQPLTIQILISGTLDAPRISLTSSADPPLSQTDLLSYLAFGRSSTSLLQAEGSGLTTGGSGSSNIVGRAAALAQQQLGSAALGAITDQVAGEGARALGADVFNIMPADVSADVGNFLRATQVEFGKYIQARTFLGLQVRPDPAALQRPGFQLQHVIDPVRGYSFTASFEPRYLLRQPSLSSDLAPQTTSVFGMFLAREWRH